MKDKTLFSSKDLTLACCLRAAGLELIKLEQSDRKIFTFVFSDPKEKAELLIQSHWAGKLLLPTNHLFAALNELKTRMYSGV